MTTVGWIICAALLIGYLAFGLWALAVQLDLHQKLTSHLPPNKQFPLFGDPRGLELYRQYKLLFPKGTLVKNFLVLLVASMLCLVGAIFTASIFHLSESS